MSTGERARTSGGPAHDHAHDPAHDPAHDGVDRLGAPGRAWRSGVVVLLAVGFVAGSLVGDDHWWPFAPWRMYSTSTAPTGAVRVFALEVTTASDPSWQDVPISLATVGLNRAELEGRWDLVRTRPEVLVTLAEAHQRLQPDAERWRGVRLVRRSTPMVDGSPSGDVVTEPLAQWTDADGGRVLGS